MNYSDMSDDAINLAIFEIMFGAIGEDRDMLRVWQQGKFQPCSSWADAGPIILSNRIGLEPAMKGSRWVAQNGYFKNAEADESPLRAAMIVFLMMQDKK